MIGDPFLRKICCFYEFAHCIWILLYLLHLHLSHQQKYSGKSQISKIIIILQYGFVSTNITLDHYSVQVVLISVVNLAQALCQFHGLINLEVLKWHTPQDTETDTMIKGWTKSSVVNFSVCWTLNDLINCHTLCVDFSAGWILGSERGSLMLMRCLHTKQNLVFMGTQKVVSSRK